MDDHTFSSVPVSRLPSPVGNSWRCSPFPRAAFWEPRFPQAVHRPGEISFDWFPQASLPYYDYAFTYRMQEFQWAVDKKGQVPLKPGRPIQ
jgi:hypothetical protein